MGLFKKKEKTHFERDEEGRVVQVTRNGQDVDAQELKMKTGQQLEQEYYSKHPEKKHPTLKKIGAGMQRVDRKIVQYNRRSNIMNPQRTQQARPVQGFSFNPPGRSNANPFGSMFDTGQPGLKKKKKPKIQYKIIGGKAYPIASTMPKKKSKKEKSKQRRQRLNDSFGFSGW